MKYKKYTIAVIVLYIILLPLFFIFTKKVLNYDFSFQNFYYVVIILLITLLSFYFIHKKIFNFKIAHIRNLSEPRSLIHLITYALIIAVPEEIIFRGIIQGYLQMKIESVIAIFLSSVIFGLAHLPNGAPNFYPNGWNWKFAILAFLGGLPLGLIFFLTNSLLIPTLLHALFAVCIRISELDIDKNKD